MGEKSNQELEHRAQKGRTLLNVAEILHIIYVDQISVCIYLSTLIRLTSYFPYLFSLDVSIHCTEMMVVCDALMYAVSERLSENIHIVANEPSLAFYRIQEHVRKTLPQLLDKKVTYLGASQ